jgi:tetratricopeptide (TPR) repeat protein
LHEVSGRLDALDIGEPNTQLRALLSWSYATLSPPAAELFRFLGLHPGPDVAVSAAASLSGRPVPETRRLLSELAKTNLLTEYVPGRYSFHDLLRAYARDLVATCDSSEARSGASRRMLDHYLHCAYAADHVLDPSRDPIAIPPPCPELAIQHPSDVQRALEWFTGERLVLLAVVAHALETGFDRHAWQLVWTLRTFLFHQGYWHDQATAGSAAVIAAQRSGDHVGLADARNILATACMRIGRFDDAHAQLLHALEQHCHDDNQAWQGPIQQSLGYLWEQQGCYARALEHVREALRIHRQAGNRRGMARALSSAGWLNALLGDHQSGISCCQRSLALLEELGDQRGLAGTWDSLGYAHYRVGEHREAQACFHRALDLFRQVGDRYHEAVILTHVGDSYVGLDDGETGRTVWIKALEIFTDLGHGDAGPLRDKIKNLTAVS